MNFAFALLGGVVLAVAGAFLVLTASGAMTTLGWVFLVLGLIFVGANIWLRNWLRQQGVKASQQKRTNR